MAASTFNQILLLFPLGSPAAWMIVVRLFALGEAFLLLILHPSLRHPLFTVQCCNLGAVSITLCPEK